MRRHTNPCGMAPMFTMTGGKVEDLSWVAADEPSYECTGRPAVLRTADGETQTLYPCGWILPASCFRPNATRAPYDARPVRSRCVMCEEEIRTAQNRLDFYGNKVTRSVRAHYRKERKEGLHAAKTFAEYLRITGIDLHELARRMRDAAERDLPCPHCTRPWSTMPGGAEMHQTLDRRDPTRLLSMDNIEVICKTGNSQNARCAPKVRNIRAAVYRLRDDIRNHGSAALSPVPTTAGLLGV